MIKLFLSIFALLFFSCVLDDEPKDGPIRKELSEYFLSISKEDQQDTLSIWKGNTLIFPSKLYLVADDDTIEIEVPLEAYHQQDSLWIVDSGFIGVAISVANEVDTTTVGIFSIYFAAEQDGVKKNYEYIVIIKDRSPPQINFTNLNSGDTITHIIGSEFKIPEAKGNDVVDTIVPVTYDTSLINFSNEGIYTLLYSAINSFGDTTVDSLYIHIDKDDDGDGTINSMDADDDNNGYLDIHNINDLHEIRLNLNGEQMGLLGTSNNGILGYELKRDLDFNADSNYQDLNLKATINQSSWDPIGRVSSSSGIHFLATNFNGNGHTIKNLPLKRNTQDNIGLFIGLSTGDSIFNLNVTVDDTVMGRNSVGTLLGNNMGIIKNVEVTGVVSGNDRVGGLAGINSGSIINCKSNGVVKGTGSKIGGLAGLSSGSIDTSNSNSNVIGASNVGGLIGDLTGSITLSFAQGDVTGSNGNVGGLVGISTGGVIKFSYASGNVTGNDAVGGLIGRNSGEIINPDSVNNRAGVSYSFATGAVVGETFVGGLFGTNLGLISSCYATGSVQGTNYIGGLGGSMVIYGGDIENSYSMGNVSGNQNVGGFLGRFIKGTLQKSYWELEKSGTGIGIGSGDTLDVVGKTTIKMQTLSADSTGWDVSVWDFGTGLEYPGLILNGVTHRPE